MRSSVEKQTQASFAEMTMSVEERTNNTNLGRWRPANSAKNDIRILPKMTMSGEKGQII